MTLILTNNMADDCPLTVLLGGEEILRKEGVLYLLLFLHSLLC